MRPIGRIRARTMSRALRLWIEDKLIASGFHRSKSEKSGGGRYWWRGPGYYWVNDVAAYTSLLSAARAAGIRRVPAI